MPVSEWIEWVSPPERCTLAREETGGAYFCTREPGHTGPCAAWPRTGALTPTERWPTLLAIGLGDALDAVERVAAWAQRGKHPGPVWASQTTEHQTGKLLGHIARAMKGETRDEETGEPPYAHVAARALMLVGLALRK